MQNYFYGTFHMNRTFMVHCTIKVLFAYAKYQGFMQMGQPRGTPLTCFPSSYLSALLANFHGHYCVTKRLLMEVAFHNSNNSKLTLKTTFLGLINYYS